MIHETIFLKNVNEKILSDASIVSYCPDNFLEYSIGRIRKCILVIPGGGYEFVSEREAEAIALKFVGEDLAVFVLKYTVSGFSYPTPIDEVFAAIKYIRDNHEKYHVDVNSISVLGFSAGGHLAASSAMLCEDTYFSELFNCDISMLKINGVLLAYPVITMGENTHYGTSYQRCHDDLDMIYKMSVEKHITPNYPPTFIWLTAEDSCVPAYNSLALAQSLVDNHVLVELHMYPLGHHGLATADTITNQMDYPDIKNWINQAIYFIKNRV